MKYQKEKLEKQFTIASKRIKYLRINLPKDKKLYSENCKMLMKESKMTQTEKYTMLLDWKNQYCQNDYDYSRQSTESMPALSNCQRNFSQN